MVGADLNVRLEKPPAPHPFYKNKLQGLVGMSVKEMADSLQNADLIEAIRLMMESPETNAWCRCGSRIPWKDCHAAISVPGQDPHCAKTSRLRFRYSPLAACPCNLSKNIYFDCCWLAYQPTFLDDITGQQVLIGIAPLNSKQGAFMMALASGANNYPFSGTRAEQKAHMAEQKAHVVAKIRQCGASAMRIVAAGRHPKSPVANWDVDVYTGVIERLNDATFAAWTGIHWEVEKLDLLRRVKEWNAALDAYCNDTGLSGSDRERVISLHTASPYAPCGNIACDKWEKSVKEFDRCGKCKSIAYCCRGCQKAHWKEHKDNCSPQHLPMGAKLEMH